MDCEKTLKDNSNNIDEEIEEKCWQPQYKGDSRKWLIRDASVKLQKEPLCSTMRATYRYPEEEFNDETSSTVIGQRKALILQRLYEEAANEIRLEKIESEKIDPEYCTEYDGNYNNAGFQPEDDFYMRETQLYKKYPLYASSAATLYEYSVRQKQGDKSINLPGVTQFSDTLQPFKKCAAFTKPLNEVLDE